MRLCERLASALNPQVDEASHINVFLDDRELVSGQPLTETLREKAQRSALLLVLMSPLYPKKSWCLDELEWFFVQAERDGRDRQHCVVLRIQPLPDEAWPKRLKDERGNPVVYREFADPEEELPLGLDDFEAPALRNAIRDTFIELKEKLKELRKQLEARRAYQPSSQAPPIQPVVYLHAQPPDLSAWQEMRTELGVRAIVNPDSLPEPIAGDPLLQHQRDERLNEYKECDALVLLRARNDDSIRKEVMAAYKDRQRLFQKERLNIPWAIIDRVGGELPIAASYRIPRVIAAGPDWPDHLVQALGLGQSEGRP
jgi:hypothetical protein